MEYNYIEGDYINNNKIIKVTDHYVYFENLKISKAKLNKTNFTVKTAKSSNILIDWTNKESVINYYNSFEKFSFYNQMGDKRTMIQTEVKDNLIYYNNQYWIPSPTIEKNENKRFNELSWNVKRNSIKDGMWNVEICKRNNSWFGSDKNAITLNIFTPISKIHNDISLLKPKNLSIYSDDQYLTIDYTASYRDGLNVWFKNFDIVEFFKEKYINIDSYGQKIIIISDKRLRDILEPIEDECIDILKDAISNGSYKESCTESYGEFRLDYIKINKHISLQIFDIINNQIKKY